MFQISLKFFLWLLWSFRYVLVKNWGPNFEYMDNTVAQWEIGWSIVHKMIVLNHLFVYLYILTTWQDIPRDIPRIFPDKQQIQTGNPGSTSHSGGHRDSSQQTHRHSIHSQQLQDNFENLRRKERKRDTKAKPTINTLIPPTHRNTRSLVITC